MLFECTAASFGEFSFLFWYEFVSVVILLFFRLVWMISCVSWLQDMRLPWLSSVWPLDLFEGFLKTVVLFVCGEYL